VRRKPGRYSGPVLCVTAVVAGTALGWAIQKSTDMALLAGLAWLSGTVLLLAAVVARPPPRGSWYVTLLPAYAVLLVVIQPSMRTTDWNAEAAVLDTALWLIPAAVGGMVLPRSGRWAAAAGCWCLLLGLSVAAAGTMWHGGQIGLFAVVWR
jgi:hypothetical protein